MDVQQPGCWQCEVAYWVRRAGDPGSVTGLTVSYLPSAVIVVAWRYGRLGNLFSCCFIVNISFIISNINPLRGAEIYGWVLPLDVSRTRPWVREWDFSSRRGEFLHTNVHRSLSRPWFEQVYRVLLVLLWARHGSASVAHYWALICGKYPSWTGRCNPCGKTAIANISYFCWIWRFSGCGWWKWWSGWLFHHVTEMLHGFTNSGNLVFHVSNFIQFRNSCLALTERCPILLFPADGLKPVALVAASWVRLWKVSL
jgi:hypothetical protein